MERLYYRSTSIVDLQAELRERELLAAARRNGPVPQPSRRVPFVASQLRRRPRRGGL